MIDSENWKQLCALAAVEEDPKRLLELVGEINRILEEQDMPKETVQSRKAE